MQDSDSDAARPAGAIRRAADVTAEPVAAADGLTKTVLLNDEHGTEDVAIRRFTLAPGASVPRHTNEVEHAQYVLDGEYVVGIEGLGDGGDSGTARSDGEGGTGGSDGDDTDGESDRALGPDKRTVAAGDAIHVPAGAVHWYRNPGDEEVAFLCAVPTGDDEIRLASE